MKSAQEEQRERKALAGSSTTTTYHQRALAELQLEQGQSGRFTDKAVVVGSKPTVQYPRMPEGSPWHSDPVPPEGPLGYAIDAQESVGEVFEVAASLNPLSDAAEVAREVSQRPAPADLVLSPGSAGVSPSSLVRGRRL
jgi:hypothetical protein